MSRDETHECVYCQSIVPAIDTVPAADDDAAWEAMATHHAPDCEWVATRAHRLDTRDTVAG